MIKKDEIRRRWELNADEWIDLFENKDEGDLNRKLLLNPTILSLADNIKNKKILDAGCGEGYLSRMLEREGALLTVGVDISNRMIELATNRTKNQKKIKYYRSDLESMPFLNDDMFDLVISNMVLHNVANLVQSLSEIFRVIKINGKFIFSILHPCFDTPSSGWERDVDNNEMFWKVDNYFNEIPFEHPFPPESNNRLLMFHRTLSTYFNILNNLGFIVEEIVEPRPTSNDLEQYPEIKRYLRVSHFLVFKCKKII